MVVSGAIAETELALEAGVALNPDEIGRVEFGVVARAVLQAEDTIGGLDGSGNYSDWDAEGSGSSFVGIGEGEEFADDGGVWIGFPAYVPERDQPERGRR